MFHFSSIISLFLFLGILLYTYSQSFSFSELFLLARCWCFIFRMWYFLIFSIESNLRTTYSNMCSPFYNTGIPILHLNPLQQQSDPWALVYEKSQMVIKVAPSRLMQSKLYLPTFILLHQICYKLKKKFHSTIHP